jgi:two-component system, cell cycle sensor histidine kinase and response regulator CckA
MSNRPRVLVVDDALDHAQMVIELLRTCGAWPKADYEIAANYDEAVRAFEARAFDIAFFDYWLGSRDGLSLLRDLRGRGVDTPVIVLTSRGAEEIAVEAMKAGAADYLSKASLTVETAERAMRHALALHSEELQRRDAEAAARATDERFRALVENSSDAILLVDTQARVVYMAPSSTRHLGWTQDQLVGKSILDFIHAEDFEVATASLGQVLQRPGASATAEVRFHHADGSWRTMEGVGVNRLDDPSVRAIVVTARDITERRRLEAQLRHSQKMEAVGQLAGGVAHDFNNLLTAILGYCNLLLDEMPAEAPQRPDLEEIRSAGERAAALTRQLLAFSRRQMLQPRTLGLNDLVRQLGRLLQRLIGEDVELVMQLSADLLPVRVDPASIEQALISLAANARDAMPTGGRLTIETSNVELGNGYTEEHAVVVPGPYVRLSLADTGRGMDAATVARVFEPFFTTKEQGKGGGLGLATVYGIVKQSGGYIWVNSEQGRGTVFKMYFPPARSEAAAAGGVGRSEDARRGWETVLLVEDEDAVRALAREVLRRHGYAVLEARHGVDALRIAERHGDDIHLMITDVVMPHMSGRDLAQRLSAVRPRMKVLFMSGYTDHAVVHRDLTPGTAFLEKPFTPDIFAHKVRHVLDTPTSKLN